VDVRRWVGLAMDSYHQWAAGFGPLAPHPSLVVEEDRFTEAFGEFAGRLAASYPFFHPRYAGQMLKPPHPAAVAGYLAAMMINPNNHALDGGPATTAMENDVVAQIARMFGFDPYLGHLTSSGTIANLEALFVARESHPDRGVAFSTDSHYTHARMCRLLGIEGHAVPVDAVGRMDLDALDQLLATGRVGTVVLTAGTTGLGAVDPIHDALALKQRHGVRLHVDAAYGGFFTLIADDGADRDDSADRDDGAGSVAAAPWRAIRDCDSVVVDPHKHGLQPYGSGAVIFADPEVGRFYRHDSSVTYFTSGELHLGEISLECSRAGAAAAALWLTLRLLPLTPDGLGAVLRPGRRAALRWTQALAESAYLVSYQPPELDIVTYFPACEPPAARELTSRTDNMLRRGMNDPDDPVYLAAYTVTAQDLIARGHGGYADGSDARILRSVLMKPESADHLDWLLARVESLARDARL
jgi:glutamate/tyrosine decarboxylase-like PLP-dependent enzyme